MTQETSTWLNTMTLIGDTADRGKAWHYQAAQQGDEPNHYDGPIPVGDVKRRLFHWEPAEGDVTTTYLTDEGVTSLTDPTRKAIVRPAGTFGQDDPGAILGVPKVSYQNHGYNEWLVENVEDMRDGGDLHVSSAGLLRGGAVAWVQFKMDGTWTAEGVEFFPWLTAYTSLDGSLSTGYQKGNQIVVCDNTLAAAYNERGAVRVKIRHSKHSLGQLGVVRDKLDVIAAVADDFQAEVAKLVAETVTDREWNAFLDTMALVDPDAPKAVQTRAGNRRDQLNDLYHRDERAAPWTGTAYGVLAAVSTWQQHVKPVRGDTRPQKNTWNAITGQTAAADLNTLSTLRKVMAGV